MGRIHLVRHGQASLLEDDYDRLSSLGITQSRATGRWLGPRIPPPVAVISGSLRRQVQTVEGLLEGAGWPATLAGIDPRFDEYSHHDLFARAYPELADAAAMAAHLRAHPEPRREFHRLFEAAFRGWLRGDTPGANGTSWSSFREGCVAALMDVAVRCGPGRHAVVATSGGPIAAICQALLGLPDGRVLEVHNPLHNASITQVLARPGQAGLAIFNSVAHLQLDTDGPELVTYR